ncbi:hypothetical protein RI367_000187 [Sorochytrium milnesiophthora]
MQYKLDFFNVDISQPVRSRCLLLHGALRASSQKLLGISVTVAPETSRSATAQQHKNNTYEGDTADNVFKIALRLFDGINKLEFRCALADAPAFTHTEIVECAVDTRTPPLHLAVLVASDSQRTIDCLPGQEQLNIFDIVRRKFATMAFMWQIVVAELMAAAGLGRSTFRFDELPAADGMPPTPRIHVVTSTRPLSDLRDRRRVQHSPDEHDVSPSLYDIFKEALQAAGAPFTSAADGEQAHVAGLLLDSHWDPERKITLCHAALGGGDGHIALGMFGSHLIHTVPASLQDVRAALKDDTAIDTRYVSDDGNSKTMWQAMNVGIGAFLHEVGHTMSLYHTPSGIMRRDWRLQRIFLTSVHQPTSELPFQYLMPLSHCGLTEPRSYRDDDVHWHPIDLLRLRGHYMLSADFGGYAAPGEGRKQRIACPLSQLQVGHTTVVLPGRVILPRAISPSLCLTMAGLSILSLTPLTLIEFTRPDESLIAYYVPMENNTEAPSRSHTNDPDAPPLPPRPGTAASSAGQQLVLHQCIIPYTLVRQHLRADRAACITASTAHTSSNLKLDTLMQQAATADVPIIHQPTMQAIFRTLPAGDSRFGGGDTIISFELMLSGPAVCSSIGTVHVALFADDHYLRGIEWRSGDQRHTMVGNKGKQQVRFSASCQSVVGMLVQAGFWVDGLQFLGSTEVSTHCGGRGGNTRLLLVPHGCEFVGLYGTYNQTQNLFGQLGLIYRAGMLA